MAAKGAKQDTKSDKGKKLEKPKPDDPVEKFYDYLKENGSPTMLLKKHLTKEVFDKLKDKKTSVGGTLKDCIKSGTLHPDSHCGLYACDAEAYETFDELFRAVIKEYHGVDKHPTPDLGLDKIDKNIVLPRKDEDGENLVISTRIRVGRSFKGKGFCPLIKKEDRSDIEGKVAEVLNGMTGEHKGTYYPLKGMEKEVEQRLIDEHFLFTNDDKVLGDAGGYREWPEARGIYHNNDKTFLVWFNEEDHLRFISMQKNEDAGNIRMVYKRLVEAIEEIEKKLEFAKHKDYGYLTCCPTNLGTTMRASVHVDLRELRKAKKVEELCEKYKLQPRGTGGESTKAGASDVYDISNKRRLGVTEHELLNSMIKGIDELIKEEVKLRKQNKGAKKDKNEQ